MNFMSDTYMFNPSDAFDVIFNHWKQWAEKIGAKGWVVGISGGKDSTVVAALAAKIFGKENVVGVMMPNGEQSDISDSLEVCSHLGIKQVTVNIGKTYEELLDAVTYGALEPLGLKKASADTITNMPARLRMTALYAVAQSLPGKWMVLNTSNLSEKVIGYGTFGGDDFGSYSPIGDLTVTEVIALGDFLLLPKHLVHKSPIDGLQPLTDEQKLGFTYADLDRYIREDIGTPELKATVDALYVKNKFKTEIVQIPGPDFSYLGDFVRYSNLPDAKRD